MDGMFARGRRLASAFGILGEQGVRPGGDVRPGGEKSLFESAGGQTRARFQTGCLPAEGDPASLLRFWANKACGLGEMFAREKEIGCQKVRASKQAPAFRQDVCPWKATQPRF